MKLADLAKARTLTFKADGNFGHTWPNGCHIAEVEVDPDTGATEVVSYCAVDDIGTVINHAIVEGQLHGGLVQGAGQVFGEKMIYDPQTGQPLGPVCPKLPSALKASVLAFARSASFTTRLDSSVVNLPPP